jgi:hypothetical protein
MMGKSEVTLKLALMEGNAHRAGPRHHTTQPEPVLSRALSRSTPTWNAVSNKQSRCAILGHSYRLGRSILVPSRRLEDRIRELCAKAVSAPDSADLNEVMQQLREALREHANRLRQLAARKLRPQRSAHS